MISRVKCYVATGGRPYAYKTREIPLVGFKKTQEGAAQRGYGRAEVGSKTRD